MKFVPVYSSSIGQRNKFRMMVKIRFGKSLSEPLGLRSLIPSLAWLSVDELRAVVTGYPSAFQALSPPSSRNTFAIPRRRRASATRALVNSRGEEQYKTTSTSLGIKTLPLILRRAGAMRTAPECLQLPALLLQKLEDRSEQWCRRFSTSPSVNED